MLCYYFRARHIIFLPQYFITFSYMYVPESLVIMFYFKALKQEIH